MILLPEMTTMIRGRDLWNTVIDGVSFVLHGDKESGTLFQCDLSKFALDVNSLFAFRGVVQSLTGQGVNQNLNSISTQSAPGIATFTMLWVTAVLYNHTDCGHGASYGAAVRRTDRNACVHHGETAARTPSGALDTRT